jgi:hypothetical protein
VPGLRSLAYHGNDDIPPQSHTKRGKVGGREVGNGTRLAIAIVMMFGAMVAFFFAFHPGGVQGVSDPDTMLQWLMGEYTTASANGGS